MKNPIAATGVSRMGSMYRPFAAFFASCALLVGVPAANAGPVTNYEVESLPFTSSNIVDLYSSGSASGPTNEYHRVRSSANGHYIDYQVNVPSAGTYVMTAGISKQSKCGQWQTKVNGNNVGPVMDLYQSGGVSWQTVSLGNVTLSQGNNLVRFQVVGVNAANTSGSRHGRFDFIGLESSNVTALLSNEQKASRFLRQATFGGTKAQIQALASSIASQGETQALEAWINNQFSLSPSLHEDLLRDITTTMNVSTHMIFTNRGNSWLTIALKNPDQLRQRTAWALSQILVTSGLTDTNIRRNPYGASNYYDVLVKNAFGNYRTLLYDVSRHPVMGRYLGHAGNKKANASLNTFPDENFAREIMQLFSIGLVELNNNGSLKLNSNGNAIETYDNNTILNFAKVFTGLNYSGNPSLSALNLDMSTPMVAKDTDHDMSAKTLLKGLTTPAGQGTLADFDAAIGNLFNHPNVGPFIGKLLIQRFTTSNPSYSYISAVSAAFNNNGSGVRGDMKAVMKAILLNPEARDPAHMADPEHGKLNETFLSYLALGRAFNVTTDNAYNWLMTFDDLSGTLGIGPFNSPSVFNFYPVDYQPQGPVTDAGLVAPEFGVLNSSSTIAMFNLFRDVTGGKPVVNNKWTYLNTSLASDAIYLDVSPEMTILNDTQETNAKNNSDLLDHIELLLVTGELNAATRTTILGALNALTDKQQRIQTAVYLVALSPEFQILR